jgi:regulator of sigma E protease
LLTIIAFIVTIGLIVTIHEYGHFQVARLCGVKVLRFSIGFGKPIWQKTLGKDKTELVLAAIPLGGYVKMLDEREFKADAVENPEQPQIEYSETELKRAFNRQHVFKRIAIVLAGPLANLLLAILIYWMLLLQGEVGMRPIVGLVKDGSLAAEASLTTGEVIQKIAGQPIKTWSDARWALLEASLDNKSVKIEAINNNNELHIHILNFKNIKGDAEIDVMEKIGVEMYRPEAEAVIGQVLSDGVAEKIGLKENDRILSIDRVQVQSWDEVVNTVKASPNKTLLFEIARQEKTLKVSVKPEAVKEGSATVGKIGAGPKINQSEFDNLLIKQHYSVFKSFTKAVAKTWQTSMFSLKMLWYMVTGKASWKGVSGPVTIASYAGESAGLGLNTFLGFLALVSISIGVLNLLPIPVLDGGHLMYYIVEIIKGSPVSEQTMLLGQKIGFGLLGLLMTVAIFNDINRIIAS